MTAQITIWTGSGILTLLAITVLDLAAIDLHTPGRWRRFAFQLPFAALLGPFMLVELFRWALRRY